jgi:hypothetical protein
MAARKNGKRPAYRINVGDRVFWPTIGGGFSGQVIEDRGHIGILGRRVLQIRTDSEYEEARLEIAVPEDALQLIE